MLVSLCTIKSLFLVIDKFPVSIFLISLPLSNPSTTNYFSLNRSINVSSLSSHIYPSAIYSGSSIICLPAHSPCHSRYSLFAYSLVVFLKVSSISHLTNSSYLTFTSNHACAHSCVTVDLHLSFSNHVYKPSRTCFMHIHDLLRFRSMLDIKPASIIFTFIVHFKLDFVISFCSTSNFPK